MGDVRRSFAIGRTAFLWAALLLLLVKASIFVLGQSVFPIGTRENLILSICTDVVNVAVGVLAALRTRDAGKSGALGFFGALVSSYGSLLFLVFSLQISHGALNRISLGTINVLSQLTLLMFVISIGRIPRAGGPADAAAKAPVAGPSMGQRATAPSSVTDEGSGLPMTWSVNPDDRKRWKPLLGPTVFVVMGIFVVVIGHPFVGASNIACFGYLLFMGARKAAALRKIGPGRITLTADGFFDDRLDRVLVPWRSVTRYVVRTKSKAGVIAGVLVVSDLEAMRDVITKEYKYAYLFSASSRNICLFLDVDGVEGAETIVDTVTHLIQKAR